MLWLTLALAGDLTAGPTFACAVHDHAVWCWGANAAGQLGTGDRRMRGAPTRVPGTDGAVEVSAGETHACARFADGTVGCWGEGDDHRLGSELPEGPTGFTDVPIPPAEKVVAAKEHSCALHGGTVSCWGTASRGAVGMDHLDHRSEPTVLVLVDAGAEDVVVSDSSTCVQSADGIRCWGMGELDYEHLPVDFPVATEPTWDQPWVGEHGLQPPGVPDPPEDRPWPVVVEGQRFQCGRDGAVVQCSGTNEQGQLGVALPFTATPETVATGVTAVVARGATTCFQAAGTWTCAGDDPPKLSGKAFDALALGAHHACILQKGRVSCTGDLDDGQLGVDRPPAKPSDRRASAMAAILGSIGGGSSTDQLVPVTRMGSARAVAVTDHASCALADDGVWCWGSLEPPERDSLFASGPCPGEDCDAVRTPRRIPGSEGALDLVATGREVCFRTSSTSATCGRTDWRDLDIPAGSRLVAGEGSTCAVGKGAVCWSDGRSPSPHAKAGMTAWTEGEGFSCWSDGEQLSCQGDGHQGQLGGGVVTEKYARKESTQIVAGVVAATAVTAGRDHACAIDGQRTLWCWGERDGFGTDGDVGVGSSYEPVVVPLP